MDLISSAARLAGRLRVTQTSSLALNTVFTNLVRVVSTVCLTRLLSPDVYGIVGLITSIFVAIVMLTDAGFQAYVIRHERGDDPDFLNAVWTIHAARGGFLTLVALILAWPMSRALAQPQLIAPLAVASLTFVIDGQASLQQFQALRGGRVQQYALFDLIPNVGQTIAAIVFAFFIRNVWAIIASMLIASLVRTYLSYSMFDGSRRAYRRDRSIESDLWKFSRVIAASSALTLVIMQVDKLALGRVLSLSQFGTYVIASTIAAAPVGFAYNYAHSIVYPVVADAWRKGGSISNAYYECWGRFFYLYAFAAGGLIGSADVIIRILYDPRYLSASLYLQVLAISSSIALITRSMHELLVASGHPRTSVEVNIIKLLWLVVGGVLAWRRDDAFLFVMTIGLVEVPGYIYSAWRMTQLDYLRWGRELTALAPIGGGVVVGLVGSFTLRALFPAI